MNQYLTFALVGLAFGSVYAAIAMGVVVTYRGTGIINFATAAMGMWVVYTYDELDKQADLIVPVVVIPHRISLGDELPRGLSFVIALLMAAIVGLLVHVLVFRPLRRAPVLAKVVASVGLMITIQALTVLHFGSEARIVTSILPNRTITLFGVEFGRDRLWLAGIVVVLGLVLWAYFRFTRLGLATRAGAENEQAISLARYSPQALAAVTWVLSPVVVGIVIILSAPTTVLSPATYIVAIVPALAAALIGRFSFIGVAAASGLAIGSFQAIATFQTSKDWWPDWGVTGLSDAIPFLIIVLMLYLAGDALPGRGAIKENPLPEVVRPAVRATTVAGLVVAGTLAITLTSGTYRFGVVTSMIVTIIMLSFVVLTGLVGQISLAQAAIAGVGGFALSKLATDAHVPFPLSLIIASLIAAAFGVVIGIPALRIRGAQLAVVTLAGAVALERFVFRNAKLTGTGGNPIPSPTIFGFDLGVRRGTEIARIEFALLVLVVLTLSALLVANISRAALGRAFLSVRSNEPAAASVGINVAAQKMLAFGLASFLAGLGGGLIGYSRGQLSAESFATLIGLSYFAFAYLGGITSVAGALFAGTFAPLGIGFVVMDNAIDLGDMYILVSGIGLILTAIFNPEGIAGAIRKGAEESKEKRHEKRLLREQSAGGAEAPHEAEPSRRPSQAQRRVCDDGEIEERSMSPVRLENDRQQGGGVGAPVVLEMSDVLVQFGGLRAVDEVSLEVREGQVVGLIGPNGAGKTTFIDAATGFVPAGGEIVFGGESLSELPAHQRARRGLVRTWQSMEIFDDLTIAENLRVAGERTTLKSVLLDVVAPGRAADVTQVEWALELMGLEHLADARPADLTLGQRKLLGVGRALASRPNLVMLDEPAAGLDDGESAALGDRIRDVTRHGISVFLVDHDMGLVLDVCDYIYVLDFGQLIAQGTSDEIRQDPRVITAYLGEEVEA